MRSWKSYAGKCRKAPSRNGQGRARGGPGITSFCDSRNLKESPKTIGDSSDLNAVDKDVSQTVSRSWRHLPLAGLALAVGVLALRLASGSISLEALALGLAAALAAVFGVMWAAGVRYPDVGWMTILLAIVAAAAGAPAPYAEVARLSGAFALAAFLASFHRVAFAPGWLEKAFLALSLVFGGASLLLPSPAREIVLLQGALPDLLAAVALGYAAVHGVLRLGPLPARRRRHVAAAAACAGVFAALHLLHAKLGWHTVLDEAVAAAFALLVLADLVIFHRAHYEEKRRRVASTREERVNASHDLGVAVQELLLSKERDGRFGMFVYQLLFEPKASGGAWIYFWERAGERRFFVGEVNGRGAQAALGVAAVISTLHECKAHGDALDVALAAVDERLATLFERQVTTSFMVVSVGLDGTVELLNCGGPGFFVLSRDGCRHYSLGSAFLGAGLGVEPASCPVLLDDGDLLFLGDAGLTGGAAVARVLDFFEEELDVVRNAAFVQTAILDKAPGGTGPSGRTLLIVTKEAKASPSSQVDPAA